MNLSRQQFTLLGIFALFLGPVLLVILMRSSWWQYQPAGLKNHGHLIQPPVHLSLNTTGHIDGKWLILYVLDQPCEQKCLEHVAALRQIHRAAGRHGEHMAIVLLSETNAGSELHARLESIYPESNFIVDSTGTALMTLAGISMGLTTDQAASNSIQTYILDPMLNVILAYGQDANPNDIHKDLKRLLKWSDQERGQ
jgi:hypothetical protein